MRSRYWVVYHIDGHRSEFETVIEHSDKPTYAELISALSPKVMENYYGGGEDTSFGTRGGLEFEQLGPE